MIVVVCFCHPLFFYCLESVTDNMLDTLVLDHDHVAVVFYQKNDPLSQVS